VIGALSSSKAILNEPKFVLNNGILIP